MSNDNKSNDNEELTVFEDEKKILLDHDYDGIRELDHPLPRWWVTTFWLTIIFAVPYYMAHTFFGAESIKEELAADLKIVHEKQDSYEQKKGKFKLTEFEAYIATAKADKVGKKTYRRKCKACHGAQGEGGVGPNLTDNYWISGDGTPATIFHTIKNGVPDKGMAAWGVTLGKEKMFAVLKIIMEFKGTNPDGAKAPQGKEYN